MAKELFIVRHAKSDWTFQVPDFERPLNDRGFGDAPRMARRLLLLDKKPQWMVSSPAKRALTTAQIFAETLHYPTRQIQLEPQIYDASVQDLLRVVNGFEKPHDRIAIFGHNPGLSHLVDYLIGEPDSTNLPTCAIAILHFDTEDWAEIGAGTGALQDFLYPKDGR